MSLGIRQLDCVDVILETNSMLVKAALCSLVGSLVQLKRCARLADYFFHFFFPLFFFIFIFSVSCGKETLSRTSATDRCPLLYSLAPSAQFWISPILTLRGRRKKMFALNAMRLNTTQFHKRRIFPIHVSRRKAKKRKFSSARL